MKKIREFINKIFKKLKYYALILEGKYLYYISSAEALPPPLNEEDESMYLSKLETDDTVKNILVEHNLRLVVYIARKFDNSNVSVDDLISIGTIGLIKAVNTFKPDKNIKLATYASRCIENEILMHLRKINRIRSEVSLDEPLNTDWDGNELLLSDILCSEENPIDKKIDADIDNEILMLAVEKLEETEKNIIYSRFGLRGQKRKTQKELADSLNISQSYISRLEKKIVSVLRKEIIRLSK